jgi:endonuclease/exonuclease/phosphatase family metal-dependent hydrolase
MDIKLMNYNILHGFHTSEKPFILERERLEAAKEIVKKENPDLLVLTEACFGSPNKYGISMDYQKIFGFPYYHHAPATPEGYEWGSAILSRFPITETRNLSESWMPFLRAQIDSGGTPFNIDVFHPHPNISDDKKVEKLKSTWEKYQAPQILAGDFNALSPQDKYDREKLIMGFGTFTKDPESAVDFLLKGRIIPYIISQGLIDTYRQANPKHREQDYTIPTDALSKNKDSAIRLDYIFCSPDYKVSQAGIIKNSLTNKASDHYPVTAILKRK